MENSWQSSVRFGNAAVLAVLLLISIAFLIAGPSQRARSIIARGEFRSAPAEFEKPLMPEVVTALNLLKEREEALEEVEVEAPPGEPLNAGNAALAPAAPEAGEEISHIVRPGETLFNIWKRYGAPNIGGSKAAEAWKDAGVSLQSLRPGDELKLRISDGDISEVRRKLRNGDELILKGNSKDGYSAALRKVQALETDRYAGGVITNSFASAARAAAVPYGVIDDLVDLFASRVEFRRDLQPGDSFTVHYRERTIDGVVTDFPGDAIISASINTGGRMLAVVRYAGKNGQSRYYDEQGSPIGNYFLRYPVQYSRISSVFSSARLHPVLQRLKAHNGVDFAAPVGTPVRAVADGVVSDSGYRGGGGNMIAIAHNSRYTTAYLHLSKIAPAVRRGARVTRGQIIGAVGMTGLASGPHLHFSLYDRGRYVDPLKVNLPTLAAGDDHLPKHVLLAALQELRNSHQALLLAANTTKAGKLG